MLCSLCGKVFQDLSKFVTHLEYGHSMKYKYECPYCRRSCTRRDNFKTHLKTHLNDECQQTNYSKPSISNESVLENLDNVKEDNVFDSRSKCTEFYDSLKKGVLMFVTNLLSEISIPRSFLQKVIVMVKDFLRTGFLEILKDFLFQTTDNLPLERAKQLIDDILSSFNSFDTEYKRVLYFKQNELYVDPQQIKIGTSADVSNKSNNTSLTFKQRTCTFIPVSQTLKQFLSIEGVLDSIQGYTNKSYLMKHSTDGCITYNNILNGSLWEQTLAASPEKSYIPIILYFDDFETSNPLGSHAGIYKVGTVYFSIPSLPPQFNSRLENIFITLIFHSSERSEFGNKNMFQCLLEDVKNLEVDGIILNGIKRYFKVVLVVGDNLGLNSILGYTESFRSTFFCRICITPKNITEKQTQLDPSTLRFKDKYESHLIDKQYGIKEYCIWNDIENFHVYQNQSLDLMHDLYEGVLRYDMAKIINSLVKQNCFSLTTLNNRVKYFNYEYSEFNHPPPVRKDHLDKNHIIFSSSEMNIFVKNFRYFIGDLVLPDNSTWLLYLALLEIVEILSLHSITSRNVEKLEIIIPKYLHNLLELFPDFTLKPKHHFLLHYPDIIRKVGPVSKISTERFEAKHRDLKKVANNVQTRKNIPLTLAKKWKMQFVEKCIFRKGVGDRISVSKPTFDLQNLENIQFTEKININLSDFYQINWYEKNGIRINKNDLIFSKKYPNNFCSTQHLFVSQKSLELCYVICKLVTKDNFNEHFKSFSVKSTNEKCVCLKINEINCRPTIAHCLQSLQLVKNIEVIFDIF